MPTLNLSSVLKQLAAQESSLKKQLTQVQDAYRTIQSLSSGSSKKQSGSGRGSYKRSAKTRRAMALAQKKRWALRKAKANKPKKAKAPKAAKPATES